MGGDSTAVQSQLRNVREMHSTHGAFAAILADGSVVTWGHAKFGGDSTAVENQLRNVREIHASGAAILAGGNIVAW
jgi:hypothetical protein